MLQEFIRVIGFEDDWVINEIVTVAMSFKPRDRADKVSKVLMLYLDFIELIEAFA